MTDKPTLKSPKGSTAKLDGIEYCGYHSCRGTCGLPAGYIVVPGLTPAGRRLFLRGSMTAIGPVMQECDPHEGGVRVDLREVLSDAAIGWLLRADWL